MKIFPPNRRPSTLFIPFLGIALAAALSDLAAEQEDLIVIQDACIRSLRFSDENFNTAWLILAGRTGDHNRKIYLQFELPQDADKATRAALRLTPNRTIEDDGKPSSSFAFRVFAFADKATDSWGETEITWNNAPGNATADPTKADAPWIEVGEFEVKFPLPSTDQPVEIPLPALPSLLKKSDGRTLTLILVPHEEGRTTPGVFFFSKEGAGKKDMRPTLLLSY